MGLNKDFIGREFKPLVHTLSTEEAVEYASAIGARNLCYFAHDGADNSKASIRMAPPSFSVTYELPMIYELLSDVELHGGEEQAKKNMLMLVHGDQREPGVVGFGDRSAGAMFINVADTEILQIAAVRFSIAVRAYRFGFRDH